MKRPIITTASAPASTAQAASAGRLEDRPVSFTQSCMPGVAARTCAHQPAQPRWLGFVHDGAGLGFGGVGCPDIQLEHAHTGGTGQPGEADRPLMAAQHDAGGDELAGGSGLAVQHADVLRTSPLGRVLTQAGAVEQARSR